MTLSHSAGFVFIHVHRTGGTSLNTLLKSALGRDVEIISEHGNIRNPDIRKLDAYPHYFIFGFTRNPWARLLSWYALIHQNDPKDITEERLRFEEFLAADAAADFNTNTFYYNSLDYFTDENGGLKTTDIFRYENYESEVLRLTKRLGLSVDTIPAVNGSSMKNYQNYYTKRSQQLVAEKCSKDIEFFGYDF